MGYCFGESHRILQHWSICRPPRRSASCWLVWPMCLLSLHTCAPRTHSISSPTAVGLCCLLVCGAFYSFACIFTLLSIGMRAMVDPSNLAPLSYAISCLCMRLCVCDGGIGCTLRW